MKILVLAILILTIATGGIVLSRHAEELSYPQNLRNGLLASKSAEVHRCDSADWPVDDEACGAVETAIGAVVMRKAKKASKQ